MVDLKESGAIRKLDEYVNAQSKIMFLSKSDIKKAYIQGFLNALIEVRKNFRLGEDLEAAE